MSPVRLVRALLLGVGMAAATAAVVALTSPWLRVGWSAFDASTSGTPRPRASDVVTTSICVLFAGVLTAVWGWMLLAVAVCVKDALTVGEPLRGHRGGPLRPQVVKALVGSALGVGLAVSPARAAPAPAAHDGVSGAPLPVLLDGLPLPDRATATAPAGTGPPPAPREVVVRAGDTLWSITSRLLPASASAAAVDAGWHLLFQANRAEIGPDPDLIQPGERLEVPSVLSPTRGVHR